ncbi:MAG: amidohydrolase family protein [Proteobacteria bacterium]|nr:amidohydrolase family protein [Pseudomonadota bacterium]
MTITPIIPQSQGPVIHRAGWLAMDADTLIENGCVQVQKGRIIHAGVFRPGLEGIIHDHGPGVLMPPLVNAHTHLELSALKGRLTLDKGFEVWVKDLLSLREKTGRDGLLEGFNQGIRELTDSGTLVVGDISAMGIGDTILGESVLSGIVFREYLGNIIPEIPMDEINGGFVVALAGHAPHTSSPELLKSLKNRCRKRGLPFSIHLGESREEMEFITTGKGSWADFLTYRGIDFSSWGIPCQSPVKHLAQLGLLDEKTLCVHVIHADDDDIHLLSQTKSPVCLCPRSNHLLHNTLASVEKMQANGLLLCLGTDSLASTPSLSIRDEMKFIAHHVSGIEPKDIFRMATENGARALGLGETFGRLEPGMSGALIHVRIQANHKQDILESIYHD